MVSPVMAEEALVDRVCGVIGDCLDVAAPEPGTDLLDSGLLDSLALVSLITEIEQAFAFEFPFEDFEIEHFRSPRLLTRFLLSHECLLPVGP